MGKISNLLSGTDLTKEARQAVNFTGQYLLVRAGPGTGKTTCISCKAYKLISRDGIDPKAILLLTFTNSAKNKMRDTLEEGEDIKVDKLRVSTLHSLAKGIIGRFRSKSSFKEDFVPITEALIKKTIDFDLKEDLGYASVEDCRAMRSAIKKKKHHIKGNVEPFGKGELKRFSQAYDKLMKFYNTVTFADLIKEAIRLVEEHGDVKKEYVGELKYVLVDEYQDLNPAEHYLIGLLIGLGAKLVVVGDENQSICSYRDADPAEIRKFTERLPNALEIVLLTSFRCPARILQAVQVFMDDVPTKSERENEGKVFRKCLKTEEKEVEWIVDKIKEIAKDLKLRGEKKEIFVLSLETTILKKIEEKLFESGVSVEAWWRAESEIEEIMPYLDLLENKKNNFALRLCLEDERGVGTKAIKRLRELAEKEDISLWEVLLKAAKEKRFVRWQNQFKNFIKEVAVLEKIVGSGNILKFLKKIISRKKFQPSAKLEGLPKKLEELKGLDLNSLRKILEEKETLDFPSVEKGGAVALSTVNKAKGRDADIVFIPALGEKTFFKQLGPSVDVEERKRMLYVAMTRAKETLYLSWSKRTKGKSGRCAVGFDNRPCCFIRDIPQEIIEEL